jgi:hypothetical protein
MDLERPRCALQSRLTSGSAHKGLQRRFLLFAAALADLDVETLDLLVQRG